MAHGYLGNGWGEHGDVGDDRNDDHDRHWRERSRGENAWRGSDQWRGRDRNRDEWRDRGPDRGMMFGGGERGWSTDDRWSGSGWRGSSTGRQEDLGGSGDYQRGRRASAHPDDHYRSWRDRHMSELDRDYEDYCREREQRFHHDFDAWRQQRHANYQPLRTGMTNSGMSHDPSGQVQVATEGEADVSSTDPMADATLGTNDEASSNGRGRR
jgi:hypothetical protein